MPKSFYGIMVRWNTEPTMANINAVDAALGKIGDWVRFSGANWLIWTDETAVPIYSELRSVLTQNDSEIVLKLDPSDYTGWAPPWIDEWIKVRAQGGNALANLFSPPLPLSPWKP
jgi:hypothetical protein